MLEVHGRSHVMPADMIALHQRGGGDGGGRPGTDGEGVVVYLGDEGAPDVDDTNAGALGFVRWAVK